MSGCIKIGITVAFVALALLVGRVGLTFLEEATNLYPIDHTPAAQCKLSDGSAVRLYHSNGSSVTTSDACSVRFQEKGWLLERMIFAAYSSPWVEDIRCTGDEVELILNDDILTLSEDRIRGTLVDHPLVYYKMIPDTRNARFNLMIGGVLMVISLIAAGTAVGIHLLPLIRRKKGME